MDKNFFKNVIPGVMHEKLTEAIVAMMATGNLPYYGEFALFINFLEAKKASNIPTAAVNVTPQGMNFYWGREFFDNLLQSETNFLLLHEEFHLLFDHIKRSVGYDQKMANIAQDMIINQIIHDEIMKQQGLGNGSKPFITIPKDHYEKNSALFIPKEYKGEAIFEDLYEWVVNKRREWQEKNKDKIQKMRQEGNKCPKCGAPMPQPGDQEGDGGGKSDKKDGKKGNQPADGDGEGKEKSKEKGKGKGKGEGDDGDEKSDQQGNGKGKGDQQNQSDQQGDGDGDGNGDPQGDGSEGGNGNNKCPNCGHENHNDKSRQGQKDTAGNDRYGQNGKNGTDMYSLETIFEGEEREEQNTLDVHLTDEIPQELKKEIVENVMTRLKNRGLTSGDVETILNKLRKTKKDYLKEIKRSLSSHIFGTKKEKTIVRPNRRGIEGLKGHKKFKNEINVLLDTSGSMGGEFERVLSYIFQNDVHMNLIQCDTQIHAVHKIKDKKELEKMRIKGLGGTTLQPGLDYVADKKNKIWQFNVVILTDGYTDSLDLRQIKGKVLILSTAEKCPISHHNGKLKQVTGIGRQD